MCQLATVIVDALRACGFSVTHSTWGTTAAAERLEIEIASSWCRPRPTKKYFIFIEPPHIVTYSRGELGSVHRTKFDIADPEMLEKLIKYLDQMSI